MEYELKPCPFCGGTATLKQDPTQSWYIECFCGVFKGYYTKKQNAIDAWNRRATDANVGDGWISVKDELPEEHNSLFAKFYGTEKWRKGMFRKISNEVLVVLKFKDGSNRVTALKTHDGVWDLSSIYQADITHWQPLPAPPKGESHEA